METSNNKFIARQAINKAFRRPLSAIESPTLQKEFTSNVQIKGILISNYWIRVSMTARIIMAKVFVIYRCRGLRQIIQADVIMIILAIMQKLNPIIVLLSIFHSAWQKIKYFSQTIKFQCNEYVL